MNVKRTNIIIRANPKRVLLRPFGPSAAARVSKIIARVLSLDEAEAVQEWSQVRSNFSHRHHNFAGFCRKRHREIAAGLPAGNAISEDRQLLIGACFSMEYSPEAAALFNPSMIWHLDQSGLVEGSKRFIISLRATGEGHISSIVFRSGVIDDRMTIVMDEAPQLASGPLETAFYASHYQAAFSDNQSLGERIIFPAAPEESNGMEDARFVEFVDEQGTTTFYATYTAYDGKTIRPRLLQTADFKNFTFYPVQGSAARNKNLALFPRKVNGKYAMLARQDNENNYLMLSEDLFVWDKTQLLQEPAFPWEYIQVGNCGSPIETDAGWLVLSHGVGPVRRYVLSAFLLDGENPARVIGRLKEPLLSPAEDERDGYVPNVVYSCGSQVFEGRLIIPYALSDWACSFAIVDLQELLNTLTIEN